MDVREKPHHTVFVGHLRSRKLDLCRSRRRRKAQRRFRIVSVLFISEHEGSKERISRSCEALHRHMRRIDIIYAVFSCIDRAVTAERTQYIRAVLRQNAAGCLRGSDRLFLCIASCDLIADQRRKLVNVRLDQPRA